MQKTRILYIISGLGLGGAERQLLYLTKGLKDKGYEILVCRLNKHRDLEEEFRNSGVEVREVLMRRMEDPICIFKLYNLIRNWKPHIVHTWLIHGNILGRVATILARAPVIIASERGRHDWKMRKHIIVDKVLSYFTDVIVTNSESVKRFASKRENIKVDKFKVIYNAVDLERFNSAVDKREKCRELGIDLDSFIIATIGRIDAYKGHKFLFEGIKTVKEKIPNLCLLIVGEGQEKASLIDLAKRLKIFSIIKFLALRYDVPEILKISDCLIHPSLSEGMPNVVLEAMACEKPVIATRVDGTVEVIKNGYNGILIEPKSPEEIAKELLKIFNDKELRRSLGRNALQTIQQDFNLDKYISSYESLYLDLLKPT